MTRKRWLKAAGWLVVFFLLGTAAWGQDVATLTGTVTDPTGAVIAGAEVTATDTATGVSRTTHTGADGTYIFTQLRPGTYRVRVSQQGFRTEVREQVRLLVATPTKLDIGLEIGAVAEQVTVEAPVAPTINTTDASVGDAFGELRVKELPVLARNPLQLLTLQPGVVVAGGSDLDNLFMGTTEGLDERDGVVNGVRANQSNVTLDGVDVNDTESQAAFLSVLPVSLDSLQEFRVITTNATATEGSSGGAQVALVTKSGSNDWHGNARWFHRNDATSANEFFNNAVGEPVPKLIRNIFGASAGGPIRHDRAFFFVDWESRRDSSEDTVSRLVPTENIKQGFLRYTCENPADPLCPDGTFTLTPAQITALDPGDPALTGVAPGVNPAMLTYMSQFPVGNDPTQGLDLGLNFTGFRFNSPIEITNNIYTARFDVNLDREGKHTVFWRGSLADIKLDLLPAQFPGRPASAVLLNNGKGFVTSYAAQLRPTLINNFRWGFTRGGINQTGVGGTVFQVRSLDTNTNFNRSFGTKRPIHEFKDDLTWIRGTHTVQGGVNYRRIRNDRFTNQISFPRFFVNNGFCLDLCRTAFDAVVNDPSLPAPFSDNEFTRAFMMLTGSITQVEASFFVDPQSLTFLPEGTAQAREFAENDFEWYIQDSWRLRPNFTLTVGLRHSYFGPVWETSGAMVRPTVDLRDFLGARELNFRRGIPSDQNPPLAFELAGKANGADAWWDPDKNNFAPRVSVAWGPEFDSGVGHLLFGDSGKSV
ncbi:MAG: carboxypeptidase regulatory-like domain-containing protein, partial [Terriglobia bacterium]